MAPTRRRWLRSLGRLTSLAALPGLPACDREGARDPVDPLAGDASATARWAAAPNRPPEGVAEWLQRRLHRAAQGPLAGGFAGAAFERGHRLRGGAAARPATGVERQRTRVAIVGTGITALSAARQLLRDGESDFRLFELEDSPGGNSRSGVVGGMACPWGAHYLPVPDETNPALRDLVVELGLARRDGARLVFDERTLCHAPQERLLVDGHWQSGLLPGASADSAAQRDYARFAALIRGFRERRLFPLPSDALNPSRDPTLRELDAQTFDAWLDAHGLVSAPLRWYLDYCCHDDFGAGSRHVSAWAGVHYFASRHGFFDSVDARDEEKRRAERGGGELSEVLTWPQGNGWLVQHLARAHRERIVTGALVTAVRADGVDVWHAKTDRTERWHADRVVLAVPLFIARRLLDESLGEAQAALQAITGRLHYASWRVANVLLDRLPQERPGAPRAWDNVFYRDLSDGCLGYVDAMHQSLRSRPGATVLSCYHAFGPGDAARRRLLETDWARQADEVLSQLEPAHPDIRDCARQVEIMRWGHAMQVPTPGLRSDPALARLREPFGPLRFAHCDLAGYSVFEEAFAIGSVAARSLFAPGA